MKIHTLKTVAPYFEDVLDGEKTFDIRKNDRKFRVGDILILKEYKPKDDIYSGRELRRVIKYIFTGGRYGLDKDYCILGFK